MRQLLFFKNYKFGSLQKPQKSTKYGQLQPSDISYFQSFLKQNQVLTQDLEGFNSDWMKIYHGNSKLVLQPNTTDQITQIMKYCYDKNLPVVPQSGNTGLVGGSVPVYDEIVLNLSKMNRIINFNEKTNILTAETGVILEIANKYLQKYNCELPWDLGAKGSCQLGGNVSTHAGGKYYVKYGPLRAAILGIEVILSNGEILDLSSEIRKDNTGIDLKQLFIGSEGSLGIISKINVLCHNIDKNKNLFVVKCQNFQSVMNIYYTTRSVLNKNLAAIEYMDGHAMEAVLDTFKNTHQNPFEQKNSADDYYVFIEISSNTDLQQLEEKLYEEIDKIQGFKDCIQTTSESQFENVWQIREFCAPSISHSYKHQFMYDISLKVNDFDKITQQIRTKMDKYGCTTIGYGHIGDGNLHLQIGYNDTSDTEKIQNDLEPHIFEVMQQIRGSISAEHGIGAMKKDYLHYQRSQTQIDLMKALKQQFDPKSLLNPYKLLPNL